MIELAPPPPIMPAAKEAAAKFRTLADRIERGEVTAAISAVEGAEGWQLDHGHGSIHNNVVLATILQRNCVDRLYGIE